jgi:3'-phosphoadenosine 5'-phosphosulfate sulfotransferase (PAPS reductase)/FAD synthetase
MTLPREIRNEVDAGALFVVNHSGGKDSQAMLIHMKSAGIPESQMMIIHADLGRVEWPGNMDHIRRFSGNLPILRATSKRSLMEMIDARGMFPSPSQRQCTSDLKRGPIERETRRFLKAFGFPRRVVNCMGMRAQESPGRKKMKTFQRVGRNCILPTKRNRWQGREWFNWLPIHHLTEDQVFAAIKLAGQEPHPIYAKGMSRLSCQFCIMASKADLTTAARLSPELYAEYVALEKRIGHTLSMSQKPLEEITGIKANDFEVAP